MLLEEETSIRLFFNNSGFEGGVFAWLFMRVGVPWQAIAWGVRYSVHEQ
jgi:hypothetical protein